VKAFVTGATGFVGGHLVEALRREGHAVTALVRNPARATALEQPGVTLIRGDLHSRPALEAASAGQDVIFHVAGAVAARSEAEYMHANRDGTANLVAAAAAAGGDPRIVLVSSGAAGGPTRPGHPATGTEAAHPVTRYGRSKLASEDAVRAGSLPWVILRPPTIYGPRDRDNLIKVFRMARLGIAPVFGRGTMEISAIYAPDLAQGLIAAAGSGAVLGHTYYVNHPEVLTTAGLVRAIGRAMGRTVRTVGVPEWAGRAILHVTGAAASLAGRATILNGDKAKEFFESGWTGDPAPFTAATGWRAAHDITTGLAETYDWYRAAGWL
jgi:nucleoside-diphosphate-sugar epimerase